MRPFNLAEALAGKPVVNGYGHEVLNVAHLPGGNTFKVAAVDHGVVETYTDKGLYNPYDPDSKANLFMGTERRTGYVNVWQNAEPYNLLHATVHYNLEQAEAERQTRCSGKKKVLLHRMPFTYEF